MPDIPDFEQYKQEDLEKAEQQKQEDLEKAMALILCDPRNRDVIKAARLAITLKKQTQKYCGGIIEIALLDTILLISLGFAKILTLPLAIAIFVCAMGGIVGCAFRILRNYKATVLIGKWIQLQATRSQ